MQYNLLIVVNKPGESPAVTTQEYNTKDAALDAATLLQALSRSTSVFSVYCQITEKGEA